MHCNGHIKRLIDFVSSETPFIIQTSLNIVAYRKPPMVMSLEVNAELDAYRELCTHGVGFLVRI